MAYIPTPLRAFSRGFIFANICMLWPIIYIHSYKFILSMVFKLEHVAFVLIILTY